MVLRFRGCYIQRPYVDRGQKIVSEVGEEADGQVEGWGSQHIHGCLAILVDSLTSVDQSNPGSMRGGVVVTVASIMVAAAVASVVTKHRTASRRPYYIDVLLLC